MKRAAFFDMDRTLLLVNSADRWIRWQVRNGEAPRRALFDLAKWLTQYTLGVLDVEALAAQVCSAYRGADEAALRAKVARWIREEILETISMNARAELDARRARGDVIVMLTSATVYGSEPVARALGIEHLLCTRLEVTDGALTGRPLAPLCYGRGKVTLAEQFAREHHVDLERSSFFTDSVSDVPMLERVGEPVVVNPDPRLRIEALRRRWPVRRWTE